MCPVDSLGAGDAKGTPLVPKLTVGWGPPNLIIGAIVHVNTLAYGDGNGALSQPDPPKD